MQTRAEHCINYGSKLRQQLAESKPGSWAAAKAAGVVQESVCVLVCVCVSVCQGSYITHTLGPWGAFSSVCHHSPSPVIKTNVKTTKRHAKSHFHLPNKSRASARWQMAGASNQALVVFAFSLCCKST